MILFFNVVGSINNDATFDLLRAYLFIKAQFILNARFCALLL